MKTPAHDNTFERDLYRWQLRYVATITPQIPGKWMGRTLVVSCCGLEPDAFIAIMARERPGLEVVAAVDTARSFERGDCDSCTLRTHRQFDPARLEPLDGMRCTIG